MSVAVLADLHMTRESIAYVDAMHSILTHRGWNVYNKPMLAGMTVTGFRFVVNRRLTAESSTAYNWMAENFLAADFLGIISSQGAGFSFDATFPLYQQHAVSEIKQSIDRGVGAIFWKDGFVVATGYDDQKQVLYYVDGRSDGHVELQYDHFGVNETPYWYYQVFEGRVALDEAAIFKESYLQAVYKWETPDLMLPESQYASGIAAYDAIISALRTGDYDREGACEVFRDYSIAKEDIGVYAQALQLKWPQSNMVASHYIRLAEIFIEIFELSTTRRTAKLTDLFIEARETEKQAIIAIKSLLRETVDNRFHDVGLR